jgi:hypothetical protein
MATSPTNSDAEKSPSRTVQGWPPVFGKDHALRAAAACRRFGAKTGPSSGLTGNFLTGVALAVEDFCRRFYFRAR